VGKKKSRLTQSSVWLEFKENNEVDITDEIKEKAGLVYEKHICPVRI
jgi:hypothetical protein